MAEISFGDALRLGFSSVGAYQLVNATALSTAADRHRLATLSTTAAAAEKGGTTAYLSRNSQTGLRSVQQLRELGISVPGADQVIREQPVTDYRDRRRLAEILAAVSSSAGASTFEMYEYPGAYLQRTQGIVK